MDSLSSILPEELEVIYEEVIMDYMYMYVVIPLCVMGVVVDKLFKIYTGDSGVVKVQYSQRHRHITHLGEMDYLVLLFSFVLFNVSSKFLLY